jgi:uridine phosphorylase
MPEDVLYHFALSTKSHDLVAMFSDIKFVCIGGSNNRMESFAHFIKNELNLSIPTGCTLTNIAAGTDRYAVYKIGPVLSISHGMGVPSVSIMLHELIKLLHHAQATDVTLFRLGTSGGLGLQPGTVVLSTEAVDELLRPYLALPVLGKVKAMIRQTLNG